MTPVPGTQSTPARPDPGEDSPPEGAAVEAAAPSPTRWAAAWSAITAAVGAVMGLLPHLLHHVTFLAGTALVTGVGGNVAFGALGLLLSAPLLRRLYRRYGTWKAPAVAAVAFTAMFVLSTTVIGPALVDREPVTPAPTQPADHEEHHE